MSDNKPISFRLTPRHRKLLESQAEEIGLSSPDLVARKLVLDQLDSEAGDSLLSRLAAVAAELEESRKDLSVATEALLAHAGKLNEGEAREWVTHNLKSR